MPEGGSMQDIEKYIERIKKQRRENGCIYVTRKRDADDMLEGAFELRLGDKDARFFFWLEDWEYEDGYTVSIFMDCKARFPIIYARTSYFESFTGSLEIDRLDEEKLHNVHTLLVTVFHVLWNEIVGYCPSKKNPKAHLRIIDEQMIEQIEKANSLPLDTIIAEIVKLLH